MNKLESPSPKDAFCQVCSMFGWNWHSGSGEEDFLISSTYFCYFTIISPWKKARLLIWTNLNALYPTMLCAKFGWKWFWRRFLNFVDVFSHFIIISPWKRKGPFIWTILNPLYPRMLCAKFDWNWPCGSGEADFFYFVNVFLLFRNYLPFKKEGPFIWTILNPLYQRMLCAKFGWNSHDNLI